MRKAHLLIFIMLLISVIFIACQKDENSLVGMWRATSYKTADCDNSRANQFLLLSGFKCNDINTDFCYELVFTFNEDGTYSEALQSTSRNGEFNGTYVNEGNTIKICIDNFCEDLVYEDDILVLNYENERTGCDVTFTYNKI